MRIFLKYLFLIVCSVLLTTCKKKTSIKVKLLNPALNEYVSNARVVLVERKETAFGNYSCEEIAHAVTDSKGECVFDREKLRSASKYQYYCVVTESWGYNKLIHALVKRVVIFQKEKIKNGLSLIMLRGTCKSN
jgi:hypothetical protein